MRQNQIALFKLNQATDALETARDGIIQYNKHDKQQFWNRWFIR